MPETEKQHQPDIFEGEIFSDILPTEEDERDAEIAELSRQLAREKDRRLEERFAWVVAGLSLVDYLLLKDVANLTVPIVVIVFQLIALLVFAKNSGIDYVAILISNLIGSLGKKIEK